MNEPTKRGPGRPRKGGFPIYGLPAQEGRPRSGKRVRELCAQHDTKMYAVSDAYAAWRKALETARDDFDGACEAAGAHQRAKAEWDEFLIEYRYQTLGLTE
jgi:hypothetical protein